MRLSAPTPGLAMPEMAGPPRLPGRPAPPRSLSEGPPKADLTGLDRDRDGWIDAQPIEAPAPRPRAAEAPVTARPAAEQRPAPEAPATPESRPRGEHLVDLVA